MKTVLLIAPGLVLACISVPACQKEVSSRDTQDGARMGTSGIPAGRFGYPLGTYLTIEGERWDARAKLAGPHCLDVDTVNGKKLDRSLPIVLERLKEPGLPQGQRCVLRGYETGRMIGIPRPVAEAEGIPLPQAAWQLYRTFIVTSVVEPAGLEVEKQ